MPRKVKPKASKRPPRAVVKKSAATKAKAPARKSGRSTKRKAAKPVRMLSGGNPQIAKGDGDAPVQAFIKAMPGWKSRVGRKLDELIVRAVPEVTKAVKWNSPMYGVEDQGFFLGFHCITKYVKVAFFYGKSLRPLPPVESKDPNTRYYHVYEHDEIDEKQFISWVRQAAAIPGWMA